MRIVQLQAENFKRIKTVQIDPQGNIVTIGGKNGSGKSSCLDAIWVALVGKTVAPPKPIRKGEEQAIIKLDLGELRITRTFTEKDGKPMTDTVKVESKEGLRYPKPQEVLDALLGEIGFDPFAFVQMKPAAQADTLLQMVPLSVDLDDLATADASDFANRRDVNRDVASLQAQINAIPKEELPEDAPDREALADQLSRAAETNAAIDRERYARENIRAGINDRRIREQELKREADELLERIQQLRDDAAHLTADADAVEAELDGRPTLDEPVDTAALREKLRTADEAAALLDRQTRRNNLVSDLTTKQLESQAFTDAMAKRETERNDALAKAQMPIDGLAFALDEKGKPTVIFNGVPFEQASTAEQLRASTAIAMSANPQLRVLRIKDGSLLDEDSMAMLAEMADAEEFQLWIEIVGAGEGVGIIMEDGAIKAADAPAETKAKAAPKPKAKPEGALL